MTVENPWKSNFWRQRILSEGELAEALALAKAEYDDRKTKFGEQKRAKDEFLRVMMAMGYYESSPEYKYVLNRIKPRIPTNLEHEITRAQAELKRKAEEERRQAESRRHEEERQKERVAELVEQAKALNIDPIAFFNDESGLRKAVRLAKEAKFEEILAKAPYYVKASYFGHRLRGDWSSGTDSYGYDELCSLDVPAEDTEHPELLVLTREMVEIASEWDGGDGRDFRGTYQSIDALLTGEDAEMLEFLVENYFDLYYIR